MRVLVVNAGSSSLKLRLLGHDDTILASRDLPALGDQAPADLVDALATMGDADAVGHRVVHGGTRFAFPARVDDALVEALEALTDLAPLHQPPALAALRAVREALPRLPAVACFDTAFHATLPPAASTLALPEAWRARWPLRRFGFHGLSHAYAARRSAELDGRSVEDLRIVTCHLGAGASLAAVAGGRSVDTTMGFTPLEGLVMATRSGSLDPGLVLWLIEHGGMPAHELGEALERESGLLGLAGSADMKAVLAAEGDGSPRAHLAVEVVLHRLRGSVASMAASMGGLDVLVFTGGVGEHAPAIRQRAVDGLGFLGVAVDAAHNASGPLDREISPLSAAARTFVVEAREDLEIARGTRGALAGERRATPPRGF